MSERFTVTGQTWEWRAAGKAATWYFMTIEGQAAVEIRYAAMGGTGGFGSVRVTVTIGGTCWQTSLFPHRESGGWLLPLKAAVRKAEGIGPEQRLKAIIEF
jgi:hypothetical protein